MRIAKLEKDKKLKRQVINRLAQGEYQWDIARSVGLNQSQISRFAAKYREQIEFQIREIVHKRHMRIIEMAFKPLRKLLLDQVEEAKWQETLKLLKERGLIRDTKGEKP